MDPLCELKYRSVEERGWWFRGRRDIFYKLLQGIDRNARILDVGCASGATMRFLEAKGFKNFYGIDISEDAINHCRSLGIKNVFVMDGARLRFQDELFDVIIASDVLEHIKDEGKALLEWSRTLKPGGVLIVFVPAFPYLWSMHDEISHHYRRYSKSTLVGALVAAHFWVSRASYWNCALFIPAFILRITQRLFFRRKDVKGASEEFYKFSLFANTFLSKLVLLENSIARWIDLPFGVSVFAVAKKPESNKK